MAKTATPTTAAFDITAIRFGNGVTFNSIAKSTAKILGLGNEAFTRSLKLGADYQQVSDWWKAEGKAAFEEAGETTNWEEACVLLTGKSRGWFNKLKRAAAVDASVLDAYKAAEEAKGQEWNIERFLAYAKDDANSAEGEQAEVGDVREVNGGSEKSKGKMLGQMRLSGCSKDVYINSSMELETEASDEDIQVMLAVFADRLRNAGFKGAAAMIKVSTKVDEATGTSIKDEAVQYIAG